MDNMATDLRSTMSSKPRPDRPFRKAVLRGLGIIFPPLLTVLIFVWVINTTRQYVLEPVTSGVREALVWRLADIRRDLPSADRQQRTVTIDGTVYRRLDNDTFIPEDVYERVWKNQDDGPLPKTGEAFYRRYIDLTYLRPRFAVPVFLAVFIVLLYLLGKFLAAGMGAFFWRLVERGFHRLPLVRNVYSSVKQVSDFLFSEREIQFTRIVAVEYPRKGMWSLGFVTNEGLREVCDAAGQPLMTVLIPCSPVPLTGYTAVVQRSDCIDLNMTFDQACEFLISCGVVMPPQQVERLQHAAPPQVSQPATGGG